MKRQAPPPNGSIPAGNRLLMIRAICARLRAILSVRMTAGRISLLVIAGAVLCAAVSFAAGDYAAQRSAAVRRCSAIDPDEYQSGLLFNPDGYRSYYVRSECFQTTAVQFRDESLCTQVRERTSIFMSSWGYSPAHCRQLVAEGLAADRAELGALKQRYVQGGAQLRSFRIERNGNGRDFDIIPEFSGRYGHAYSLAFEIIDSTPPVPVHVSGYYVVPSSPLRIFVRQADIRQRFPEFTPGRPYRVRATSVLDIGVGGSSSHWSSAFIDQVFPVRERSQSITLETTF